MQKQLILFLSYPNNNITEITKYNGFNVYTNWGFDMKALKFIKFYWFCFCDNFLLMAKLFSFFQLNYFDLIAVQFYLNDFVLYKSKVSNFNSIFTRSI